MFRNLICAAALAAASITSPFAAAPAQAQNCQSVQFPRGAYAHSVQGYVTGHAAQCWYLAVRPGQSARIRIVDGSPYFSTSHTNGTFSDVRFTTVNGQLYVYVQSSSGAQQRYVIEFAFI